MRTTIDIDNQLIEEALLATGARSKRAVVELGLRSLLRLKSQEQIKHYWGKLRWNGDLNRLRTDRMGR